MSSVELYNVQKALARWWADYNHLLGDASGNSECRQRLRQVGRLLSNFKTEYDKQVHVPRKQLSELMKKCPLVPTLYNMTVLERSRLLAKHSIVLDEWYYNLKKELLEASNKETKK